MDDSDLCQHLLDDEIWIGQVGTEFGVHVWRCSYFLILMLYGKKQQNTDLGLILQSNSFPTNLLFLQHISTLLFCNALSNYFVAVV